MFGRWQPSTPARCFSKTTMSKGFRIKQEYQSNNVWWVHLPKKNTNHFLIQGEVSFFPSLPLYAYWLTLWTDFQHHDGKSQRCTFLFCKPLQRSFLQNARAQLQHRSPSPAASVQSEQQVWLAIKSCMIRNQCVYFHLEGVVSNTGNHLEVARHFHVDQTLLKWRGDLRIKPCLQIT